MANKNIPRAIAAADVPGVFDDACVERLADIGKFPNSGDRQRWADGVRKAARIYARDARKPTNTELRAEIAALLRAAEQRQFERVAGLIEKMSPEVRRSFEARAERPGFEILVEFTAENERPLSEMQPPSKLSSAAQRHRIRPVEEYHPQPPTGMKMPSPEALLDPARRDQACQIVEIFCRIGGRYVEGRRRPTGRRSKTRKIVLYAPVPISPQRLQEMAGGKPIKDMHMPGRREAELTFLMNLQSAWQEATGKKPSLAANPDRLGPFGRMVSECLELVGGEAKHANVVKLINKLNRRRNEVRAQLDH